MSCILYNNRKVSTYLRRWQYSSRVGASYYQERQQEVKEKNKVNKLIKLVQTLDCKKPKSHDICIVLKYIQYEESKKEELISASDIMTNWINNRKFKVLQEYYKK
jgi:hypothetical protein